MTPDFDRFREGVSFGRNFGRFGWLTGDKVSSYSSGDGLLANQVLSSGGLLRQYVTSPDGKKPWRLDFRFTGTPDPATAERLNALPTVGENAEVEFGYDPSSFYSGSTPKQVKVKAINWVRKQFACADNFVADMSLASPALLLESALDTLVIDEPSTGPFTHIGYRNADGEIVSQPLEEGTVYDLESDGKLGANWVLLWSGNHTDTDLSRHAGSIPVQVYEHRGLGVFFHDLQGAGIGAVYIRGFTVRFVMQNRVAHSLQFLLQQAAQGKDGFIRFQRFIGAFSGFLIGIAFFLPEGFFPMGMIQKDHRVCCKRKAGGFQTVFQILVDIQIPLIVPWE